MKIQGTGGQARHDPLYVADGSIAAGGTCQLALAQSVNRSYLLIQNTSNGPLYVEFGSGRATCTISGGVVNNVTVTNAGQGFSRAPSIRFVGGGGADGPNGNSSYLGLPQYGAAAAHHTAKAHAVMAGNAPNMTISSIVIDDGGSNYLCAPAVFIENSRLDPYGVAAAATTPGATVGVLLDPGEKLEWNGTVCPTDPVSIIGDTTGQTYVLRWMD